MDGSRLINDYYEHSRFAEHLLLLDKFAKIFPKEYADFKKINYKTIKRYIKWILLDDVDFFASEGEDERVDFLIDIVYSEILECYNLYDSHKFWQDLRLAGGYFDYLDDEDAENQLDAERLKNREEKIKQEEQTEKKTDELIKTERDALLGVSEKLPNEEIIEFIKKNVQDTIEALELVYMFENQKPWYIWPFFSNWNRLSLLLAFYQEEKKFSLTSASFYERLTVYLVKEYSNAGLNCDVSSLVEMFSEFAFDMMENGQTIFSEQGIQNHPTFKHKLETGQIDLLTLLSFPFLVQRGKWYEFRTLAFQVYLSLRKFLQLNEKEKIASYAEFLDLNDCFIDNEHDIWILCSELDLHSFNQYYLIPILKEYLSAVSAKLKGQEADGIA